MTNYACPLTLSVWIRPDMEAVHFQPGGRRKIAIRQRGRASRAVRLEGAAYGSEAWRLFNP